MSSTIALLLLFRLFGIKLRRKSRDVNFDSNDPTTQVCDNQRFTPVEQASAFKPVSVSMLMSVIY